MTRSRTTAGTSDVAAFVERTTSRSGVAVRLADAAAVEAVVALLKAN